MVETGAMPPVVSTEAFKSDKLFLIDLVAAHLSILRGSYASCFVPKPFVVHIDPARSCEPITCR